LFGRTAHYGKPPLGPNNNNNHRRIETKGNKETILAVDPATVHSPLVGGHRNKRPKTLQGFADVSSGSRRENLHPLRKFQEQNDGRTREKNVHRTHRTRPVLFPSRKT